MVFLMKIFPTNIPDVLLIEPRVFCDERGFFFESFNANTFTELTDITTSFVQDNHSKSVKGVLRGMHYQLAPRAQGKLIRVIQGVVFDVALDIRPNSLTYGQWISEILSSDNKKQLWIPPGFAHGFLTLSETAEVLYKTTDYWTPELERCIRWDSSEFNIHWPIEQLGSSVKLSSKDAIVL